MNNDLWDSFCSRRSCERWMILTIPLIYHRTHYSRQRKYIRNILLSYYSLLYSGTRPPLATFSGAHFRKVTWLAIFSCALTYLFIAHGANWEADRFRVCVRRHSVAWLSVKCDASRIVAVRSVTERRERVIILFILLYLYVRFFKSKCVECAVTAYMI